MRRASIVTVALGLLLALLSGSAGVSGQEGAFRALRQESWHPIASRGRRERSLIDGGLLWRVRSHAVERGLDVGLVIDVTVVNRSRSPRLIHREALLFAGERGVVERGRFLGEGGIWGEGFVNGPDCQQQLVALPPGASVVLRRQWPEARGPVRGLMAGDALRVTVTAHARCGDAPRHDLALGVITLLVPPATGEPPTVSVGR